MLEYSKEEWNNEYVLAEKNSDNIDIHINDIFGNIIETINLKPNTLIYNYFNAIFEFFKLYSNTPVKDMIKEGYLLAIELDDEEEIEDLNIFNIFKYIIVNKDSKYCTNKGLFDKIIIV